VNREAGQRQRGAEHPSQVSIILDDEDALRSWRHCGR